jgi:CheY-like chemotaxis protein/Tfp pilus assembly protein PilZ
MPNEESSANIGYVLLVGDHAPERHVAEHVLLGAGLVVAATTLDEALGIPDLTPPRVVIYDAPEGRDQRHDGLRRIASCRALIGVPLVVLSSDRRPDAHAVAITFGAAAYRTKPVPPDDLVAMARRLCGWTGRGDATEKRRRLRRPLLMSVELQRKGESERFAAQMLDASGDGCRVETPQAFTRGEALRVLIRLQPDVAAVALSGEVRWVASTRGESHALGLRFTGTSALLAAKVLGLVGVSGQT